MTANYLKTLEVGEIEREFLFRRSANISEIDFINVRKCLIMNFKSLKMSEK